MKVLVCGSRDWLEQAPVARELAKLPPRSIVVHGACRGADNIAGYAAYSMGHIVRPYPVAAHEWRMLGKRAGIIRNQRMLDREHLDDEPIDLVIAFHKDPGLGKGTFDMVTRARKAGIPVEVFAA